MQTCIMFQTPVPICPNNYNSLSSDYLIGFLLTCLCRCYAPVEKTTSCVVVLTYCTKCNFLNDLKYKRCDRSAIAEHEDNHPSHKVITDSIGPLHFEKRHFQMKFKEAIFIQIYPTNIIRRTGHDICPWLPLALNLIDE